MLSCRMPMLGRWLVWLAFVVLWTWALLVPDPSALARTLLFPTGASEPEGSVRQTLLLVLKSFLFSKGLHITAYAVLAILSAWLELTWRWRWLLPIFLSLHALATEGLQNFEPLRHPSWSDVGLDHLGSILGMALSWKWWLKKSVHGGAQARGESEFARLP